MACAQGDGSWRRPGMKPYPALAVDRHWTLIASNNAVAAFACGCPIPALLAAALQCAATEPASSGGSRRALPITPNGARTDLSDCAARSRSLPTRYWVQLLDRTRFAYPGAGWTHRRLFA